MQPEISHEIADNDLAGGTLDLLERIRPHLRTLAIAAAVVFAGLGFWTFTKAQKRALLEQSWQSYIGALSGGDLAAVTDVIRRYPDSPAARWAQLSLADAALAQGCNQLFTDRSRGTAMLQEAVGRYVQLMASRPDGMLAERAVFGLARANESLGKLEEARNGYQALVNEYPGGAWSGMAAARAAALGRDSTRRWYDWFAAQDLSPPKEPAAEPSAGGTTAAVPAATATDNDASRPAAAEPAAR